MRKLSALAIASLVFINPIASNITAYAQSVAYNPETEKEIQGATTFSQAPPIEGDGGFQVRDPQALAALGYDPSRTWNDGDSAADVVQVGDIKNIYRFTDFTTRQIANHTGVDLARQPLVGVYGAQTLEKLVKQNPQIGNVGVRSVPAIEALLTGQYDNSVKEGLQTASQYFDELDDFLKENPQFRDFSVSSVVKGDWQGLLPVAQQTAFKELSERLPEHLQELPVASLPAVTALSKGNYDSAVQSGLNIASEHFEALDTFLQNNPQFGQFPIEALSKGQWEAVLPIAQQTAIKEIAKRLPGDFQGVPAASLSAISDLSNGNYDSAVTQGLEIASEHFSDLEGFLEDNPQFKNFPIAALAKGDLNGVLPFAQQTAIKEIARQLPEHLQDVPVAAVPAVTALAKGNFRAAVPATIDTLEALDNPTINQFLENHPYAKDLALGLVGQRFSIDNIPGLADQAIRTLQSIDEAKIAEIPGLDQVPLELTAAIPNIAAVLQGDLFGRFDFAWSDEDKAYNVITGSTRGRQFKPEACQVGVTPDTTSCSGIELQDGDGSLNGRFIVLGPNQKVKGGSGFLKIINNGKEQTGWQPWGPKAIDDGSLKLVAKSVTEGGGGEAANAEFELRVAFCIKKLFVNLGCSPHFIPFPFLLHPKVAQDGDILLATNSPAPDIPSSLLKQYRRKHGFEDDYCLPLPPSSGAGSNGDGSYQEATELVEVGSYHGRVERLEPETAEAFRKMKEAAARDGVNLDIASGYRSIADQQAIWDDKRALGYSDDEISKVNTRPGFSEHHTGRAVDIVDQDRPDTDFNNDFRNTEAGRWLNENAQDFGFEKSYPLEDNNGIQREEWHWRYVGSEQARQALNLSDTPVATRGTGDQAASSTQETFIGTGFGSEADVANLIMTSVLESGSEQAQLDVAVSILNRVNSPLYPNTATEVTFQSGQYEPNFGTAPVNSKREAISRLSQKLGSQVALAEYERLERNLNSPERIAQTQAFLQGATDFRGVILLRNRLPQDPWRGSQADNWFLHESQSTLVAARTLENLGISSGDFEGFSIDINSGFCGGAGSSGPTGPFVQGDGIARGNYIHPAPGPMTSPFGMRWHPIHQQYLPHDGIDIGLPEGTPVKAVEGGIVVYRHNGCVHHNDGCGGPDKGDGFGRRGGYGNRIEIEHPDGTVSAYNHLQNAIPPEGTKISQGQVIGTVGSTGYSTGPHLDFQIWKNGVYVDPENYINFR